MLQKIKTIEKRRGEGRRNVELLKKQTNLELKVMQLTKRLLSLERWKFVYDMYKYQNTKNLRKPKLEKTKKDAN
jgi:hypothetical protein